MEGVERTPTPAEPLVPGAAARADALACSKCGGLPAGEASGAGDLCLCEPAPSPSGITDEMVQAAALALADEEGETSWRQMAETALRAGLELQAGERTPATSPTDPRQIGSDAIDAFVAAIRDHEPNDYLGAFELRDLVRRGSGIAGHMKGIALRTLEGGEPGERTHTLVPVEIAERTALKYRLLAAEAGKGRRTGYAALMREWEACWVAAARGDRSVRWPGDDTAGGQADG